MSKKHKSIKLFKRFFITTACAGFSTLVVVGTSLVASVNNLSVLAQANKQNRAYTTTFGSTKVSINGSKAIEPFVKNFWWFAWRKLVGDPYYPKTFELIGDSIYIDNISSSWNGFWSNNWYHGRVGEVGAPYYQNYFWVHSYDPETSVRKNNIRPNYQYNGKVSHGTFLQKTSSYSFNLGRTRIDASYATIVEMSKLVSWNHDAFTNRTNSLSAKVSDGGSEREYWGADLNTPFEILYDTSLYPRSEVYKYMAYSSFIFGPNPDSDAGVSLYHLPDDSTYGFNSLESSTMPANSVRGDYIATTWAQELINSNKPLLSYYQTNCIPSTYDSLSGTITADNLKGEIVINVTPGITFDKYNPFDETEIAVGDVYYKEYVNTYRVMEQKTHTFRYTGFKQVKPTELITKINVDNLYIQPQYVTSEEIKRIILAKGIKGDTPVGFTTDNIIITDIKRYNTVGTIRATVYLNLYYDRLGDIQTRNFTPQTIQFEGFAKTNLTILSNTITVTKQEYTELLPTDLSVEKIQELIYQDLVDKNYIWVPGKNNPDACFPQNFVKEDLIIKNGDVSANNLAGTIRVDVSVKNYFDENGEIVSNESSLGRVTIRNLKKVQRTMFGFDTYDYTGPNDSLYPTDVVASPWLLKNYIATLLTAQMKPDGFYPDRDIQLSDVVANNKDGTIRATVSLNSYYDADGVARQTGFTPRELTFNFQKSITETFLPQEINLTNTHSEINAYEVSEEEIKQIIVDNMLLGKPDDITTANIKFNTKPNWDSAMGRIIVSPTLNYWVDSNGLFRTDPKTFDDITIFGFAGSPATKFNTKKLEAAGTSDWIPTSYARETDKIKDLINKNMSGKPNDFDVNNIEILEIIPNNTDATLQVKVSLNYYIDANGNPQTKDFEPVTLIIGGFGMAEMPTTITGYIVGDSEKLAQHYSHDELKKLVLENINSPVPGTNETNLSLKNIDFDYLNGRITLIPVLNLWYDSGLAISTTPKDFPQVTIGNLKNAIPTTINVGNLNIGDPNVLPSEFAEDYVNNILPMVDNLILNKPNPDLWDPETDITINHIVTSDLQGSITMDVILNNYIDVNGLLTSSGFAPQTITITGFDSISGATSIETSIRTTGFENVYPFEVTTTQVRQLIFENLKNKVPGLTIHNVTLYSPFTVDNFAGIITASPYINAYYDDAGNIINKPIRLNDVIFTNFNHAEGETKLTKTTWIGDNTILPSEAAKDVTSLKTQVYNNIIYPPKGFDIESDIELNNLYYDNITATISFDVEIKKKFDATGTIVTGEFDLGNVTITNYRVAFANTSISNRILTNDTTLYASQMNEQQIKELIFENVNNEPKELDINGVSIKENSIEIDNRLGTIKLIPILNWTYNAYGELSNIPKEFDKVTIYGFKKATRTNIPVTVINATKYPEIANLFPNELASDMSAIKDLAYKLIDLTTVPTGFGKENIEIYSIYSDNFTGSINFDIKLNYYFDKDGVIRDSGFLPVTITIVDMKKASGKTSVLRLINSSMNSKTPQDITDGEIKQLILNNTSNTAPNFGVDDITFKVTPIRNNLDGTIKVIPIFSRSYDVDNNVITSPVEFNEVTISGFKTVTPTTLMANVISYDSSNILASELSNNINELKDIILQNLSSAPGDIKRDNVIIDPNNIISDNITGSIKVGFSLNHYYNANGLLTDSNFGTKWITINKLLSINKTSLINRTHTLLGLQDIIPSTYPNDRVISYIKTNLSSTLFNYIPNGFDIMSDLQVDIIEKNNLDGSIIANIKMKKYYNDSGQLIIAQNDDEWANYILTLNGFAAVKPTNILSEVNINQSNILAQDAAFNISTLQNIIVNNISKIVENLPSSFGTSDLIFDLNSIKSYNNEEGYIILELGIRNFYDQNGYHVISQNNSNILKKVVKITGFMNSDQTTIIPIFNIKNYKNYSPSIITNSDIISIINYNSNEIFTNLPSINSIDGNLDVQILTYDNQKGEVTANVSIYEYYNQNGDLVLRSDNMPLTQKVVFSGFKKSISTRIVDQVYISDQDANLASNIDEKTLKKLLYSNINSFLTNLPSDFSNDTNLSINILSSNNTTGTIEAQVSLNYYYDDNGNVVFANNETEYLTRTIVISGFKKVKQTMILNIASVDGYRTVNPYEILEIDLVSIIYQNLDRFFINLPSNFQESYINVNIISIDKKAGDILANITISQYYNENEILINDGSLSQNVLISGFLSTISPGSSIDTLIAVVSVASVLSIVFASSVFSILKFGRKRTKL